jgi:hypothetical protein
MRFHFSREYDCGSSPTSATFRLAVVIVFRQRYYECQSTGTFRLRKYHLVIFVQTFRGHSLARTEKVFAVPRKSTI